MKQHLHTLFPATPCQAALLLALKNLESSCPHATSMAGRTIRLTSPGNPLLSPNPHVQARL